ncbi:hypothetical protein [Bacillus piscicola]|uniref:hypothetical protein n=1 Tax=Bacillus piscicola TaxID=1632684 RepID=UPI001F08DC6A|nr:hypothetical protein [Bacillus piscicola]
MRSRAFFSILLGAVILVSFTQTVTAEPINNTTMFKATAETEQGTFHWKYDAGFFTYEENGELTNGKQAEQKVVGLYNQIKPYRHASKEELAAMVEGNMAASLQRLDVRWMDESGNLYTWLYKGDF